MTCKEALKIVHGLSKPGKMPCPGYSLPAKHCKVGTKLRKMSGSACAGCYAFRGNYPFPIVQACLERRYQAVKRALSNAAFRAEFVQAFTVLLEGETYFRWHDSGDLINLSHAMLIQEICRATPHVKHWLPTREYTVARAMKPLANLTVRISAPMIDGPIPNGFTQTSTVTKGKGNCPAITGNGKCNDCRRCWNKRVRNVSYHKH